jgi:hypothetical protein
MNKHIFIFVFFILTISGCRSSILDNPFSYTHTIEYSVPMESHVKLTIENNYNTVVATPVDEIKSAGYWNITINSSDYQAGVYFYTIESQGINNIYYNKITKHFLFVK